MTNPHFLLKQSLYSTKEKLLEDGAPINTMFVNYTKVLDNINIYKTGNAKILDLVEKLKLKIKQGESINTITIIKSEKISEVILDYIIISILLEIANYFAYNNHSVLDLATYTNGMSDMFKFNTNQLFLADLRNLHLKKTLDQETYLMKLINFINKRLQSKLYNIIIINDNLKDIIENNDYITSSIKGTLLIK